MINSKLYILIVNTKIPYNTHKKKEVKKMGYKKLENIKFDFKLYKNGRTKVPAWLIKEIGLKAGDRIHVILEAVSSEEGK